MLFHGYMTVVTLKIRSMTPNFPMMYLCPKIECRQGFSIELYENLIIPLGCSNEASVRDWLKSSNS